MTGTKCRGICDRPDNDFVKSASYQDGKLNFCAICMVFVVKKHTKCPCCRLKLRTKPKATKDRRSKEGDQAFIFFDLAIARAKFELSLLPKFHTMPDLGEGFIQSVFAYCSSAIQQFTILEESQRQRPDYLKEKRKQLDKFKEKMLQEIKNYWSAVYS